MNKLLGVNLIAACILLSGCSDDDSDGNVDNSQYIGTWSAPAYGEAIVVEQDSVYHYQYTSSYCIQSDIDTGSDADLASQYWTLAQDQLSMRQQFGRFGTDFRQAIFYKNSVLPESCLQNLVQLKGETNYQVNPERDFDLFWQTFNEYYPAFEQRNVDWSAIHAEQSVKVTLNSTDEQLYYVLAGSIESLEDSHVGVYLEGSDDGINFTRSTTFIDRLTDEFIVANGPIHTDEAYVNYVNYLEQQTNHINDIRFSYAAETEQIKQAANDKLFWYVTDDNIGYLSIEAMYSSATDDEDDLEYTSSLSGFKSAMDQAMTDLNSTEGLIIDIRQNPGGFDGISQLITKYFLDTERHLYSKQARLGDNRSELETYSLAPVETPYLKPIVLLTSAATTSAAEVFTLMMRELPHVTLVGEATQGAFSDVLSKRLPNGFSFDLINEYYLTPEGEWFEGFGVPVDQTIEFATESQRLAGVDEGINTAIGLIKE